MKRIDCINKIVEEILQLSATNFEFVSYQFLCKKEDVPLIHRGVNLDERPVGYTPDIYSDGFEIIGECGTGKDYFTNTRKMQDDFEKAKKLSKNVKKIYLISNQVAKNTEMSSAQNLCYDKTLKSEIYDGRRFAEELYDLLIEKQNLIVHFSEYLPKLNETIMQSDNHFLPEQSADYNKDSHVFDSFSEFVNKNKICILYGLSGSGKTLLVLDYAHSFFEEYENIYWINSDEIKKSNLCDIYIRRFNININLIYVVQNTKSLVIIDGFDCESFDDIINSIENKLTSDSRLIITSINCPASNYAHFPMPEYSDSVLNEILLSNIEKSDLNVDMAQRIVSKVKSHPLTLNIINKIVATDDFKLENFLNNMVEIEVEDNKKIFDVVLKNLNEDVKQSLGILKFLETKLFDFDFLKEIMGAVKLRNLITRSLIMHDKKSGTCSLHDIVFLCLKESVFYFDENELYKKSLEIIKNYDLEGTYNLTRVVYLFLPKIKGRYSDGIVVPGLDSYILLLQEKIDESSEKIILDFISKSFMDYNEYYEIKSLIEAHEKKLYSISDEIERKKQNELIRKKIDEKIESCSDSDVLALLYHHKGKLYRNIKNVKESIEWFLKANERNKNYLQTNLQLARSYIAVYRETEDETYEKKGIEQLKLLEKKIFDKAKTSSSTLSLSFIELLPQYRTYCDSFYRDKDKIDSMASFIIKSSVSGYSQSWRAFIAFSQKLWFINPALLTTVFPYLMFPGAETCGDSESYDISECYKQMYKATAGTDRNSKYKDIALKYLKNINEKNLYGYNLYKKTKVAETLTLLGDDNDTGLAIKILDTIPEMEHNQHSLHRKAKALLKLKKYDESLECIEDAVKKADEKYLSTMLEVKSDVLYAKGQVKDSKEILRLAIGNCGDKKNKERLNKKLCGLE